MWTIIAEKPLLLAIMIGVFAVGFLYAWLQTGNKRIGIAGLLLALLVPGAFVLADQIVTDREKILNVIDQSVQGIENNDHEAAVAGIGVVSIRSRALQELQRFELKDLGVRNIKIDMVQGSFPPEATADCDASATISMKSGSIKDMRVHRRIILTFRKENDGRWMIVDYTHQPLAGGPDAFTPQRL